MMVKTPIAIVGQGCVLPHSFTPQALWEAIEQGRVCIDAMSQDADWGLSASNFLKHSRGGYIQGFSSYFNPGDYALPHADIKQLDPFFHWSFYAAKQAWLSMQGLRPKPSHRVGVIMGNLSYPSLTLNREVEAAYLRQLSPVLAERSLNDAYPYNRFMSGGLALLTAKALGFHGPAFAIDAACASSLYAMKLACDYLRQGKADVMLAGGVCGSDPLFLHLGFTAIQAISKQGMSRPFCRDADGLLPAQGAAVLTLKRLDDAVNQGDTILAVIRGIGLSNDGRSRGLLVPDSKGQQRCVVQAFRQSKIDLDRVDYIECHATGTLLGDQAEIETLKAIFPDSRSRVLSSSKANFGHLITASSAAACIKVLKAMEHKKLPSTPNAFPLTESLASTGFEVLADSRPWRVKDQARVACVSGFGFGGNNAHMVLEAWEGKTKEAYVSTCKPLSVGLTVKDASLQTPIAVVACHIQTMQAENTENYVDGLLNPRVSQLKGEDHLSEVCFEQGKQGFPPYDLKVTSGQQLILLKAIDQILLEVPDFDPRKASVLIGMDVNPEVGRYVLRERLATQLQGKGVQVSESWLEKAKDAIVSPLTPASLLGKMPNMPANRLNQQRDIWGASYTVSCEELSGDKALSLGVMALRSGDIDYAIVGAVGLSCDPVHQHALAKLTQDVERNSSKSVVMLMLKPLADAERDGNMIYSVIDDDKASDKTLLWDGSLSKMQADRQAGHCVKGLLSIATASLWLAKRLKADQTPYLNRQLMQYEVDNKAEIGVRHKTYLKEAPSQAHHMKRDARLLNKSLITYAAPSKKALIQAIQEGKPCVQDGDYRIAWINNGDHDEALKAKALNLLMNTNVTHETSASLFYREKPIKGRMAFMYTGAASAYTGMGRELLQGWSHAFSSLSKRLKTAGHLADWALDPQSPRAKLPFYQLAGSSVICQLHTEISRHLLGLKPQAAMGLSSGETNALVAFGVWQDMDALMLSIEKSGLYDRYLGKTFESVKQAWGEPTSFKVNWENWQIFAPVAEVKVQVDKIDRVYLTLINTDHQSVIGGDKSACRQVLDALSGYRYLPLQHDIAVHCPVVKPFEKIWRNMHTRSVYDVPDMVFYSNYLGGAYTPTMDSVADALTGQALQTVDFRETLQQAWQDGVRIFVEHGPRSSLTHAVKKQLCHVNEPFLAVAMDDVKDSLLQIYRVAASLWVAGSSVNVDYLQKHFGMEQFSEASHKMAFSLEEPAIVWPPLVEKVSSQSVDSEAMHVLQKKADYFPQVWQALQQTHGNLSLQHQAYLTCQSTLYQSHTHLVMRLHQVLGENAYAGLSTVEAMPTPVDHLKEATTSSDPVLSSYPGPTYTRKQLEILASGRIADVFGELFAKQADYKIQCRLPEPPLLLCDRILGIQGEAGSMRKGCLWSETDVTEKSWYLHRGRMPMGIMIESGQADLALISWLGIDLETQGKRAYRLLGCELTFLGELPKVGDTLHYEIHIDGFAKQGNVRLFFFHYDCFIDGKKRLAMRHGQAGFFTKQELAEAKGVLWSAEKADYIVNPRLEMPENPCLKTAFTDEEVQAYTQGRMMDCFGQAAYLIETHTSTPRSASGKMNFIQRIACFSIKGGPKKRGYLRAENQVNADDWYFKGHFKNDPCMPGTLMTQAGMQMMAFYMTALGFTNHKDGWRFEPATASTFQFICRGQVTPRSKQVVYELFVNEILATPYPLLNAHLLVTVDGRKAFLAENFKLALVPGYPIDDQLGLLEKLRKEDANDTRALATLDGLAFDRCSLHHTAYGWPTKAFSTLFDEKHDHGFVSIARLPSPPYLFMTRILACHAKPHCAEPKSRIQVAYDIPQEAWYFKENTRAVMPYCVLMEVALQPCGWLAVFTLAEDKKQTRMLFRNLDGEATQHREVTPSHKSITTEVILLSNRHISGMTLCTFEVKSWVDGLPLYTLKTTFGFFSPILFENQKGLSVDVEERKQLDKPDNCHIVLQGDQAIDWACQLPKGKLGMLDTITYIDLQGGCKKKGYLRAERAISPCDWYFKAHFFSDPVQPGSLGVEAFLQLIQSYACYLDLKPQGEKIFDYAVSLEKAVEWHYRGQVTPCIEKIQIDIDVLATEEDHLGYHIHALCRLWVKGIKIYQAPLVRLSLLRKVT